MAKDRDDIVVEFGAMLAAWGGGVLAVLFFDGWPSYVLAGLAFCLGVYLMVAVWFEWPRPGRGVLDPSPPPSNARIQVTDSPDWEWEDTTYVGGDPLVDAKDSPGWKWKGTTLRSNDRSTGDGRRRWWRPWRGR